jgi:antibiotic biosynthesis monooxygenase (ABM) superfamily enzyme
MRPYPEARTPAFFRRQEAGHESGLTEVIDVTVAINTVMVDCRPEVEAKYNEWYDRVHIPMCLKYEGMLRATRYRLLKGPTGHARYLTVYEFRDRDAMDAFPNSQECRAAIQEMHQTWREEDFSIKLTAQYETIGVFGR